MAMTQNEISVIGGTQIPVGMSQVVRVVTTAFQYSCALKIGSGGSLEILKPQLSGSSTATGALHGTGYLIGANEVISWDGAAVVYLLATGATVVAHATIGYTAGASMP